MTAGGARACLEGLCLDEGTGRVPLVVAKYYVNSNKLTSRTEDIDRILQRDLLFDGHELLDGSS